MFDNDKIMYDWIVYQGYEPVIIATKLDKLKRSQVAKQIKLIKEKLGMPKEGLIFPLSVVTKQGREEIWDFIEEQIGLKEEIVNATTKEEES